MLLLHIMTETCIITEFKLQSWMILQTPHHCHVPKTMLNLLFPSLREILVGILSLYTVGAWHMHMACRYYQRHCANIMQVSSGNHINIETNPHHTLVVLFAPCTVRLVFRVVKTEEHRGGDGEWYGSSLRTRHGQWGSCWCGPRVAYKRHEVNSPPRIIEFIWNSEFKLYQYMT